MIKRIIPEGYYTENQMARLLTKTISSLRSLHSRGTHLVPPKTKVGKMILYSKESFAEWLKSKEIKPAGRRKYAR